MAYNQGEDHEEDGDEEIGENEYKSQKDAVLFAIEVSSSMLETPSDPESKDKDSAVTAALKSASRMMQQRIIAQPKDMMGVLFFGTAKTKFRDQTKGSSYPNCYLHTDVNVPSAQIVKTLRKMAEDGEDPDGILTPSGGLAPVKDMLTCANQVFTTGAPNFGSRRLFIITDKDDPFRGDKDLRRQAAVRAKDLFDLGVTVELFPIRHDGSKFDLDKFYTDIIYLDPLQVAADPDSADEIKTVRAGDGVSLLNSLTSSITAKQTPKRAYFSKMNFQLAPGMTISVNGYLLLHKQVIQRSCYVYLEDEGVPPQLAKNETIRTEEGSMRTVEKTEIKKAYKFGTGGDFVYFSPQEMTKIREFDKNKCLRIIGFKPRSMLPTWAAVKKSTFIFPTESGYVGSTRVFSALWQKLLDSKKMAIAWYIPRKNAVPRIVAILPSEKPSDEDSGTYYLPAGLWLYPLPFVDDMRDLNPIKQKHVVRASDELRDQMRTIVQNLSLPKGVYDPEKYPNPALQYHYKILQAMALEEELPDGKKQDLTEPKYRQINKRVGAYQADFKKDVNEEAERVRQELEIKREAEDDADDRPKKRAKTAPKKPAAVGGTTLADLNEEVQNDTLRKRVVPELKAICTEKGLDTSGKKADLLERIEQWLESQS